MRLDRLDQPLLLYPSENNPTPLFEAFENAGYKPAGHPLDPEVPILESAKASPLLMQFWWVETLSGTLCKLLEDFLLQRPLSIVFLVTSKPDPDGTVAALRAGAMDVLPLEDFAGVAKQAVLRGLEHLTATLRHIHAREYHAAREGFNQGAARLLHDLNSPLTAIQSAFEMIEMDLENNGQELSSKEKLLLKGIDSGRKISEEWHGYLFSQRGEMVQVNLFDVLAGVIDLIENTHPDLTIETFPESVHPSQPQSPPDMQVTGDSLGYELIFYHLLLNAAQAVEDAEGGKILVHVSDDDQIIRVRIEDNGPGVHPDLKDTLWKDFQTTRLDKGQHGMGLGIARYLLMHIGGSVRYADQKTLGGASFEVELRIRPPQSIRF